MATDESVGLAVLADGMGGYNAGEVASGMATSFIHAELGRWLREAERGVLLQPIVKHAVGKVRHGEGGDAGGDSRTTHAGSGRRRPCVVRMADSRGRRGARDGAARSGGG